MDVRNYTNYRKHWKFDLVFVGKHLYGTEICCRNNDVFLKKSIERRHLSNRDVKTNCNKMKIS